ncbi:MAG: hypothetical protein ACXABK_04990, partial [Candidatus Heimdallarchaeaceae archaeon]
MTLSYRTYQEENDLNLQYEFWINITRDMPWAWKPTISPKIFIEGKDFDPRTRVFAFIKKKLVGYMSFTGEGNFISLGYPWVLPGCEGEIQEELYDRVFGFASRDEDGGKFFAQRFREQWKSQILYFQKKGFSITSKQPVLGINLSKAKTKIPNDEYIIELSNEFSIEDYIDVARRDERSLNEEEELMVSQYYKSVDFDYCLTAKKDEVVTALLGVT